MKAKIILATVFVALVSAFFIFDLQQYLSLEDLKGQKEALNQFYSDNPVLVLGGFFLIYVLAASLGLPIAALLTLASGAIFGFWTGFILVSFASSIGATLAFLLSRFLFHDAIHRKFGDRLDAFNKGVEEDGAFYLFGLRLVPLPFFLINTLMGLTKMKTWTFYWVSQIGMLAGTAVYVNAGTQLAQIDGASGILNPKLIASFVLLGVFPILAKKALGILKDRQNNVKAGE